MPCCFLVSQVVPRNSTDAQAGSQRLRPRVSLKQRAAVRRYLAVPPADNRRHTVCSETDALTTIARYGSDLQSGISRILRARAIDHCFVGHPSMGGLFFSATPPKDYRDWVHTDYAFYDALAPNLHDHGVLVEPDSREPWFICEAHATGCLEDTLQRFEQCVDITLAELTAA